MDRYRVIQCATGTVGLQSLRAIVGRADLELVGLRVYSADKRGIDAGELYGGAPLGVAATDDFDEILSLDADCVVYNALGDTFDANAAVGEICRLLESGKNVSSTAVSPPWSLDEAINSRLAAACEKGGSSYLSVGLNPGFVMDLWPVVMSRIMRRVDRVVVTEMDDMCDYTSEQLIDWMGFGRSPDSDIGFLPASGRVEDTILYKHFHPCVVLLERALGLSVDDYRVDTDFALAQKPIEMAVKVVQTGTISAIRSLLTATSAGRDVISFEGVWYASLDLPEGWPVGEGKSFWRMRLEGEPDIETTLGLSGAHGGGRADMVATGVHAVNAVPTLCEASPGIKTFLDLPAFGGFGGLDRLFVQAPL